MLQGLTNLATGGSPGAAVATGVPTGAPTFNFVPAPGCLEGGATEYGPTVLTSAALPTPYGGRPAAPGAGAASATDPAL